MEKTIKLFYHLKNADNAIDVTEQKSEISEQEGLISYNTVLSLIKQNVLDFVKYVDENGNTITIDKKSF